VVKGKNKSSPICEKKNFLSPSRLLYFTLKCTLKITTTAAAADASASEIAITDGGNAKYL
jgi:hypothetical protein